MEGGVYEMNLNDIKDIQEYVRGIDKKMCPHFLATHPRVADYYDMLKSEICMIEHQKTYSFIERMRLLLNLDAKLQILLGLSTAQEEIIDSFGVSEEELIQIIESDCRTYYRESLGKRTIDDVPWSLICLSDQI